ncbi:hypothetical protein DPEC_G00158220 [Dallia pectoralis]|uniref:Uncharacterized protein n=1 Tax=Dallia pectoralis TaxID=75939 RepID=A0ACC2GL29_DALPE|nr:hypothetical protein DPEC_G00158220 [Dallia pectoralis]
MADLALLEDAYVPLRRERVFQDRRDLLNESDEWLMSRFQGIFSWSCAITWSPTSNVRPGGQGPYLFQSRTLIPHYIQFPYDNGQQTMIKREFYEFAGIPNVIGDRGYPLLDFLITPVPNPVTHQERRFNHAHARTRATVERCVGLLKGRWLCLAHAGGTLLYQPKEVCNIILACAVLHNMAEINRVPFDALAPDPDVPVEQWAAPPALGAVQLRRDLVWRF